MHYITISFFYHSDFPNCSHYVRVYSLLANCHLQLIKNHSFSKVCFGIRETHWGLCTCNIKLPLFVSDFNRGHSKGQFPKWERAEIYGGWFWVWEWTYSLHPGCAPLETKHCHLFPELTKRQYWMWPVCDQEFVRSCKTVFLLKVLPQKLPLLLKRSSCGL